MEKNFLKDLSEIQKAGLFEALYYMNMSEIKNFCYSHKISISGKKGEILDRIKHYRITGEILQPKKIPAISKAKDSTQYPLTPETLILFGSYTNDLMTRNFFKSLIGEHFHFTAFGQDWIMKRWQQGKPPTYGEFAKVWQKEYLKRKKSKANPKKEWAYLNYLQRFVAQYPDASKKEFGAAWKKERNKQAEKAIQLLNSILNDADRRIK